MVSEVPETEIALLFPARLSTASEPEQRRQKSKQQEKVTLINSYYFGLFLQCIKVKGKCLGISVTTGPSAWTRLSAREASPSTGLGPRIAI